MRMPTAQQFALAAFAIYAGTHVAGCQTVDGPTARVQTATAPTAPTGRIVSGKITQGSYAGSDSVTMFDDKNAPVMQLIATTQDGAPKVLINLPPENARHYQKDVKAGRVLSDTDAFTVSARSDTKATLDAMRMIATTKLSATILLNNCSPNLGTDYVLTASPKGTELTTTYTEEQGRQLGNVFKQTMSAAIYLPQEAKAKFCAQQPEVMKGIQATTLAYAQ